jgi:predicted dehydrogenase
MIANSRRIGLVGLDSSHCREFSRILNAAPGTAYSGARIVAALDLPPSVDFRPSLSRHDDVVASITDLGIPVHQDIDEFVRSCDSVIVTASDPRTHPSRVAEFARRNIPVYIDTRLAGDRRAAATLVPFAEDIFCLSPKAWATPFRTALSAAGRCTDIELTGPLPVEPPLPTFSWYGTHLVQVAYAALGPGCRSVAARETDEGWHVSAEWQGGRRATMHARRGWNPMTFGTIWSQDSGRAFSVDATDRTFYQGVLRAAVDMFERPASRPPFAQMIEVVAVVDAIDESLSHGRAIFL